MDFVKIFEKPVGNGYPCYIVAEIGGAFSTFEEAKRLIDSAKEIGIDAVKFQTLEAETITTKNNFYLQILSNKYTRNKFQNFLIKNKLSSNMWIVAQKK